MSHFEVILLSKQLSNFETTDGIATLHITYLTQVAKQGITCSWNLARAYLSW